MNFRMMIIYFLGSMFIWSCISGISILALENFYPGYTFTQPTHCKLTILGLTIPVVALYIDACILMGKEEGLICKKVKFLYF